MSISWVLRQWLYPLVIILSGCAASLPPYLEPDKAKEPTARLRTAINAGVSASVLLHPNNDSNRCLIEDGAVKVPIHTNVSGFAGDSKRKIGMPFTDAYWGKIGSEVYIPAKDDLTLSASFSGSGATSGASCRMAFRFKPIPDKNYQLFLAAGQGKDGRGACVLEFQEIYEDGVNKKMAQRDAVHVPVVVWGSRAWPVLCEGRDNK